MRLDFHGSPYSGKVVKSTMFLFIPGTCWQLVFREKFSFSASRTNHQAVLPEINCALGDEIIRLNKTCSKGATWCFFNMSKPRSMSMGWASSIEKLEFKLFNLITYYVHNSYLEVRYSCSIWIWAMCTLPESECVKKKKTRDLMRKNLPRVTLDITHSFNWLRHLLSFVFPLL